MIILISSEEINIIESALNDNFPLELRSKEWDKHPFNKLDPEKLNRELLEENDNFDGFSGIKFYSRKELQENRVLYENKIRNLKKKLRISLLKSLIVPNFELYKLQLLKESSYEAQKSKDLVKNNPKAKSSLNLFHSFHQQNLYI